MRAVIGDELLDRHLGVSESGIGCRLVADRPLEDVVVVLARAMRAAALASQVLAQHRSIGGHRLEGIDDHRQLLVFDLDGLDTVGGRIAILRHDKCNLLVLEQHLAVGQHHLHIACERRHPGEIDALQLFGREHRQHARHLHGLRGIDALNARMGILASAQSLQTACPATSDRRCSCPCLA